MTQPALQGTLASSVVTRSTQNYASAAGMPSPTLDVRKRVAMVLQGNYRAGIGTEGITQTGYFVEQDGIFGEPELFEAAAYDGTDVTFPTGSFAGKNFNSAWRLWVPTTVGTWTAGLYPVTAKVDDETLTVTGPASTDPFTGYLLEGLYAEPYMALGAPTASAMPNFAAYPGSGIGPIDQSPWHDYGPYIMPATLVNGGRVRALFEGRIKIASLAGRPYQDADLDGAYEVVDKCVVYFTVDPFSLPLAHPYRSSTVGGSVSAQQHNEVTFFPSRASRLGWTPTVNYVGATFDKQVLTAVTTNLTNDRIIDTTNFNTDFPTIGTRIRVTVAATSGLSLATDYFVIERPNATTARLSTTKGGGLFDITGSDTITIEIQSMRVNYTAHGLQAREIAHIAAFDLDADNVADFDTDLGVPSTLIEGQGYYIQAGSNANSFYLSEDFDGLNPVEYVDDASSTLIIAQPVKTGSHHAMSWAFTFDDSTGDEIADFSRCVIELIGVADGRTADTEEGVLWTANLYVFPASEHVGTQTRRQPVLKAGVRQWGSSISRTTPGQSTAGDFAESDAIGAPMYFLKGYWTPSDTVAFADATGTGGALSGQSFQGAKVNDAVTITAAGTTGLSLTTYFVHSKPNASNPHIIKLKALVGDTVAVSISNSTADVDGTFLPTYGAFKTSMWDWGGVYDIVHVDSDLVTQGLSSLGMTDYPVEPTYQGNDVTGYAGTAAQIAAKNASPYRRATVSRVKNAAGDVVGEVCYHDPIRRVLHVRPRVEGEHITYGDALTVETFRYVRTGSGTTWATEASAIQTKTCNALTVELGPNGTRLSTRIAVSGPPTGDCELNIRTAIVETTSIGSR
jgi:hypothetical protein